MERVPDALAEAQVLDESGQPFRVGDLWRDRPVLLMFVRHFGCMFCSQQVSELKPHLKELEDAGVRLAVIGSGTPNFARGFKERLEFTAPIYSDEKLATYRAASMKRGIGTLLDPRVLLAGATAIFKYRQRSMQGDNTQQGGVLVVRPDGTMPYRFISQYAGDHAKPADVVQAALAATAP